MSIKELILKIQQCEHLSCHFGCWTETQRRKQEQFEFFFTSQWKMQDLLLSLSRLLHLIWMEYLIFLVMEAKQRKTHSGTHVHQLIILRGRISDLLLFFQWKNLSKVEQDQWRGLKPFLWCSWSLFKKCVFQSFSARRGNRILVSYYQNEYLAHRPINVNRW